MGGLFGGRGCPIGWNARDGMPAMNRLVDRALGRLSTGFVSTRWCSSGNSKTFPVTSTKLLPWSVVQPFGSIKVDLTQVYSEGWENCQEVFPQLLLGEDFSWFTFKLFFFFFF